MAFFDFSKIFKICRINDVNLFTKIKFENINKKEEYLMILNDLYFILKLTKVIQKKLIKIRKI